MSKQFLKNQSMPTKACRCGRGTIYTRDRVLNAKIDGVDVCEECMVDYLVSKYELGTPGTPNICWGCGNNIGAGEEHWEECHLD